MMVLVASLTQTLNKRSSISRCQKAASQYAPKQTVSSMQLPRHIRKSKCFALMVLWYILAVWTKLVIPLLFEKMDVCLFLIFLYYESTKLTWIAKYRNDIILFVGIEESMKLGTFHIVRCLIMFFKYALLNDVEVQ